MSILWCCLRLFEHYPWMTKELHQGEAWLQFWNMLHPNLLPWEFVRQWDQVGRQGWCWTPWQYSRRVLWGEIVCNAHLPGAWKIQEIGYLGIAWCGKEGKYRCWMLRASLLQRLRLCTEWYIRFAPRRREFEGQRSWNMLWRFEVRHLHLPKQHQMEAKAGCFGGKH